MAETLGKVFEEIVKERQYQTLKWGFRQKDGAFTEAPHSPSEFILYMEHYLAEARKSATLDADGSSSVLDSLRKVVTLGVACFEQHGIASRPSTTVINARDGQISGTPR